MISEDGDVWLIKQYLEADGENIYGPRIFIINANSRESVERSVKKYLKTGMAMVRIEPIMLPIDKPLYLGTTLREIQKYPLWAIDR